MTKLLLIILVALVSTSLTLSDKEILQQALNGMFEQNKLKDPTTIVDCGDDATSHKIVVFIGEALDKAAKGSVSELIQAISMVKDFINSLPPATVDCINNSPQTQQLMVAYNLDSMTPATIEKKVAAYVTLHYLTVHKWMVDCDDTWNTQKYYETGFKGADYLHNIFGTALPKQINKEIIQQLLNGIFQVNKLPNSTTIVPCIDDGSANQIVPFIAYQLDRLAKGNLSDVFNLLRNITSFTSTMLDPAVEQCLNQSQEWGAIKTLYNFTDADPHFVEKQYIAYTTLHYLPFHKWAGDVDNDWAMAKYYQVGQEVAVEAHLIWTPVTIRDRLRQLRRNILSRFSQFLIDAIGK